MVHFSLKQHYLLSCDNIQHSVQIQVVLFLPYFFLFLEL